MKLNVFLLSALLIGILSFIGFSWIAILISTEKMVQFDQSLITFIQGFESETMTAIMRTFTFIGSFPTVLILFFIAAFILYRILKSRSEVIWLGVVLIGGHLLNQVLKVVFQRDRPDFNMLIEIGGYSFPSGHSMNAFILYSMLIVIFWRHLPHLFGRMTILLCSMLLIFMIGISRIYLGVHYPSDVISGYFAGALWVAAALIFFEKNKGKKDERNERI